MEQQINNITKLQAPQLASVYPRERLFQELDTARTSRLVWLSGTAGCGKTTLASSYLSTRKTRCLWYRIDEDDNDPASFFHYMSLAAKKASPHRHSSLPALTSEYQMGIETFTRRFFEQLFSWLKPPCIIVFDNYERISTDSSLHAVVNEALQTLPEKVSLFVTSRQPPPAAFARLQASQNFSWIDDSALRLTEEEAHSIAQIHSRKTLGKEQLNNIHLISRGWMAGLILMANSEKLPEKRPDAGASIQVLFDYFAEEVFKRIEPKTQQLLQQLAVMPTISEASAIQLTKNKNAGSILAKLAGGYFFTYRHQQEKDTYQFHPLFREFLLEHSKQTYTPKELSKLKQKAAVLLEEEQHLEAAFDLYASSEQYAEAARLVSQQAPALLQQGRSKTLLSWLSQLPQAFFEKNPWLLYWDGEGKTIQEPLGARAALEQSYELFLEQRDTIGATLSCCSIIDTFKVLWDDFHQMDPWIDRLETLLKQLPDTLPEEVDVRVSSAILSGYLFRRTGHPDLQKWQIRAEDLIHTTQDPHLRTMLAESCFLIRLWKDGLTQVSLFLDHVRPFMAGPSSVSICKIWMYVVESCYHWNCADIDKTIKAANAALQVADNTGVHAMALHIHFHSCIANVTTDKLDAARKNLTDLRALVIPGQLMNEVLYHQAAGVLAWHENDLNKAYEWIKRATELSENAGINFSYAFHLPGLAIIMFERGNTHEAEEAIQRAEKISRSEGLTYCLFDIELFKAYFALQQGQRESALKSLNNALEIGSRDNRIASVWWRPYIMSTLCTVALEAGIQTDYVRLIIYKRKLKPNRHSAALEQWPWPARIHTLGGLRIEIDGEPLAFGSKPPAKPLELLKTLIAMGGQKVKANRLADRLWPDAEGDDALESFKITLRRLRKLLRIDDILPLHECSLSLNLDYCWTDVTALLQLSNNFPNPEKKPSETRSAKEIIRLYAGSFLGEDDILSAFQLREQLRSTFLHAVSHIGEHYEANVQWQQAIDCYEKGLKAEELTEVFYQQLIVCYLQLELPAEALQVYSRCERVFERELGIEPSSKTQMLLKDYKVTH
ncbi:MAG: hypothetical protein DSZ28_03620 [Thiothrix sp.]|nr:MAG: hypothetical protein DSZ28_03620 [Thiothrix sp.]